MLKGKNILLGITGGIAAYKMANTASLLVKQGADVHVIMTRNATKFITAETLEILTKNKVFVDVFDEYEDKTIVPHIELGTSADCILIAPCSADVVGKIANGIADDMLTTAVLPARCPVLICPSMNVYMYENKIVQDNIKKLKKFGYTIIEPAEGHLACGYDGKGKLPKEEYLVEQVLDAIAYEKTLKGKKVVVSAGPTEESFDPVRFITNHSSGKMGYSLARVARMKGADVTLVSGPVSIPMVDNVKGVMVKSAEDMFNAVTKESEAADIVIMAAAVADYTPAVVADNKIKKKDGDSSIELKRTKDILKYLGEHKKAGQFICGFSMETRDLIENSSEKLSKKNCDMICANLLTEPGAGYKVDTNVITVITREGLEKLPIMSKMDCSAAILDRIQKMMGETRI